MIKKTLLVIGIILVVGLAAFFIIFGGEVVGTEEGESRVGFSIRDYFPFGGSDSNIDIPSEQNGEENTFYPTTQDDQMARLRKISSEPVAGAAIFNSGTTTIVRFVERGTGNVYEARSDSNQIIRLTNTTIPKVVRAFWLPDGSGFLAQTISLQNEIIETGYVKLNKNISSVNESLTPYSTVISSLPTGIREISISPDGKKIAYYTKSSVSSFYTANPDGTNPILVATHPLTEWVMYWVNGDKITLQSKADSSSESFAYDLHLGTKTISKIGFGFSGLTVNPNQGGTMLVSTGGARPTLNLRNPNGVYSSVNTSTLSEKCVWRNNTVLLCAIPNGIPTGQYPEDWYKGLVSTEDFIIEVDTASKIASNVSNLSKESSQKIDVIDPIISKDGSHLAFRNKIDGFLWLLRISE